MFCSECGRELKENEVCHCLENIPKQPDVIGVYDPNQRPALGAMDEYIMREAKIKEEQNKNNNKKKNKKELKNEKKFIKP